MSGYFFDSITVERIARPASFFGRTRWRLRRRLAYKSPLLNRIITVPAGFETDFASVPRWPLVFLIAGETAPGAAIIHDYLVSDIAPMPWQRAASVFSEALKAEGITWWRRVLMVAGVRLWGIPRACAAVWRNLQ